MNKNTTQVDIPDGVSGGWSVKTFTVTPEAEAFERMRSFNPSTRGRWVPAGTYKSLMHGFEIVMSNTPDEIEDLGEFVWYARGTVLINGLGLGCALRMALDKKDQDGKPLVKHVTVVEKSEDVIKLVAPWFEKQYPGRMTIVEADAFEYKPPRGVKYHAVWHDIWSDITDGNLEGMETLTRKYARRTAWQGCWCRELIE